MTGFSINLHFRDSMVAQFSGKLQSAPANFKTLSNNFNGFPFLLIKNFQLLHSSPKCLQSSGSHFRNFRWILKPLMLLSTSDANQLNSYNFFAFSSKLQTFFFIDFKVFLRRFKHLNIWSRIRLESPLNKPKITLALDKAFKMLLMKSFRNT